MPRSPPRTHTCPPVQLVVRCNDPLHPGHAAHVHCCQVRPCTSSIHLPGRQKPRWICTVGAHAQPPQVLGAAKMVIEGGGKHPGALKDSVASPAGQGSQRLPTLPAGAPHNPAARGTVICLRATCAGTTIAGLHALERAGIRGAFMNAVIEATRRSDELAKM